MQKSLKGLSTFGYQNINPQKPKPVKLINVLQYFWEAEEKLSGEADTCTDNCEHFQNRNYIGGDGCYGAVRDCQFKIPVHTTETQLLQVRLVKQTLNH